MNEIPAGRPPAPVVSVIIPSWNTSAVLARCLRDLHAGPEAVARHLEIIVIDDASHDDSAQMVARKFPRATVIVHEQNMGFAATCNDGARIAHGEWLLFLNSDAFIRPQQIERLRRLAEDLGAAAIGPQLVGGDGRPQDSGGAFPRPSAIALTKVGRLLGRDLTGASHLRVVRRNTRCDWITGACLLVRGDVFRSAGGFDDRLTYVEDVELGARITGRGGLLFLTDQVKVTHLGGESFRRIALTVPRLYRDSQRLLARMYLSQLQRFALLAVLAGDGLVRQTIRWVQGLNGSRQSPTA